MELTQIQQVIHEAQHEVELGLDQNEVVQGLRGVRLATLLRASCFTDLDAFLLEHFDELLDEEERAAEGCAHLVRHSCCEGLCLARYVQLLVHMLVYDLIADLLRYVCDLYGESRHAHIPLVPYFESVELAFW